MSEMADLTNEELAEAKRQLYDPKMNTMWLGEWAAEFGTRMIAEIERRRGVPGEKA